MQSLSILLFAILHVRSVQYRFDPRRVFEIPHNGLPKAFLKRDLRSPPQLSPDLRRIHGISSVVPGPVRHKANEGSSGFSVDQPQPFIRKIADQVNEIKVPFLAGAPDIVAFTRDAFFQNPQKGRAMVFNMEPVSDVSPVSVHREIQAVQGIVDHHNYPTARMSMIFGIDNT
jgi:hypothetical protein